MKLSSHASMLHLIHQVITKFASLSDFDENSIQNLPKICNNSIPVIDADYSNNIGAKAAVSGAKMSSISVSMLVTAVNTAKYYVSIARFMNAHTMMYPTALANFKVENET